MAECLLGEVVYGFESKTCYFYPVFTSFTSRDKGTWYRSSLRHYVACRQVAGSIPDEIIGFFNLSNPSSLTMALGSTKPLTETSTRNFPVGKE
jgi:hypothetical protein